jgi:hypothetical protein
MAVSFRTSLPSAECPRPQTGLYFAEKPSTAVSYAPWVFAPGH